MDESLLSDTSTPDFDASSGRLKRPRRAPPEEYVSDDGPEVQGAENVTLILPPRRDADLPEPRILHEVDRGVDQGSPHVRAV